MIAFFFFELYLERKVPKSTLGFKVFVENRLFPEFLQGQYEPSKLFISSMYHKKDKELS